MKSTKNPWPFAIILAFILFISGTVSLVVMACSQRVDLVSDNYYEQEIHYQDRIDQFHRAQQLSGRASISYDSHAQRVTISLPRDQAQQLVKGRIEFYRPSAAGLDCRFDFPPNSEGVQQIDVAALRAGLWKLRVLWSTGGQDYFIDQNLTLKTHH